LQSFPLLDQFIIITRSFGILQKYFLTTTFIYLFHTQKLMNNNVVGQSLSQKFKSFLIECRRVWQVTKKPTKEELKVIVKVTGIGILAIGALGFVINMLWQLLLK